MLFNLDKSFRWFHVCLMRGKRGNMAGCTYNHELPCFKPNNFHLKKKYSHHFLTISPFPVVGNSELGKKTGEVHSEIKLPCDISSLR